MSASWILCLYSFRMLYQLIYDSDFTVTLLFDTLLPLYSLLFLQNLIEMIELEKNHLQSIDNVYRREDKM